MSKSRCKVEVPSKLPDSELSRVQFKEWKEATEVYLKQNEDFSFFLPGGRYENWVAAEENPSRIDTLAVPFLGLGPEGPGLRPPTKGGPHI